MIKFKENKIHISQIENANLITHSGTFHADEVFSTIVLKNILDKEIFLCRTNFVNVDLVNDAAVVYDIGGGFLDHHQLGGNGERANGIKYASFGLVWREYGKKFLEIVGSQFIDEVWESIEYKLVQAIDAVDNGQLNVIKEDGYIVYTISDYISTFNVKWDEDSQSQDDYFIQTVEIIEKIFESLVKDEEVKQKAKKEIELAINESKEGILILDKYISWKECLLDSTNPKAKEIYFVVFPSTRGGYNVYTVPVEVGSFESRKLLPESWAGLQDDELQNVTGVESAVFCHNARFICSAKTKEDAIKLAQIAINE